MNIYLGGGFKYFLSSTLPGEMIQFDQHFSNGLKPPTRYINIYIYEIYYAQLLASQVRIFSHTWRTGRRRSLRLPCWSLRHGPDWAGWIELERVQKSGFFFPPRKLRWNLKIVPNGKGNHLQASTFGVPAVSFWGCTLCYFCAHLLTWIFGFNIIYCCVEHTQIPCIRRPH